MSPRRAFDRYMIQIGMGTNPKLASLTDSEFRAHTVGILAIAAKSRLPGYLLITPTVEATAREVATVAGVKPRQARRALEKAIALGLLQRDERVGAWYVTDWPSHDPRASTHRRPLSPALRAQIIARDGCTCRLCGAPVDASEIHVDHVVPVAFGGTNDPLNLQIAHATCNQKKGARR